MTLNETGFDILFRFYDYPSRVGQKKKKSEETDLGFFHDHWHIISMPLRFRDIGL